MLELFRVQPPLMAKKGRKQKFNILTLLCNRHLLYKSLFVANYPGYMRDMFTRRSINYNLPGTW